MRQESDKLKEECGVVGVYNPNGSAGHTVWEGLFSLQHRGQESAGIAVANNGCMTCVKDMGLVAQALNDKVMSTLPESGIACGHVRYSTTGDSSLNNVQPMVGRYSGGWIALCHNGNLSNIPALEQIFFDQGDYFHTTSDSELLLALIIKHARQGDIVEAVKQSIQMIRGSYAVILATPDCIIGVRDPLGIRPLVLGKFQDGGYCMASESCALDTMNAELVRDVAPGELVLINGGGLTSIPVTTCEKSALCVFEYVYFARPDSVMDGLSVYQARYEMGRQLARIAPVEADMVAAVPDSALPAAKGYSAETGIPTGDALVRNRFVGRTFIQPEQSLREKGVNLKLCALKKNVEGKRIVLIDDSIVRGTTSKQIVAMLKRAGAKEVHLRIASPPVRFSCYYGIDTPTREELAGASYSVDYIRQMIGADSLEYMDQPRLLEAVKGARCGFCCACFDGQYPVDI